MDRPAHVFTDSNSLWAFYNYVTIALQHSHPKTWMEDQRVLHYFISTANNFQQCSIPAQIVPINPILIEADTAFIDPNQTNLLDQIAQAEADLEADLMDEDLRYKHAEVVEVLDLILNAEDEVEETLVTYTDPAGNTFETIDFHNAVTADPGDDDDDDDIWTEQHIVEKDDTPFEIDENQEWTGENASHMSTKTNETTLLDLNDISFDLSKNNEADDENDLSSFF
jgi:hypothetical protein